MTPQNGQPPAGKAHARTGFGNGKIRKAAAPWRTVCFVAAATALGLAIGVAAALFYRPDIQLTGTAAPVQTEASAAPSPFADHAKASGVLKCASTFAALGNGLASGTKYAFQTQASTSKPDLHAVQGTVGMSFEPHNGFTGDAAGVILVAPTVNSCDGHSVRVTPVNKSCAEAVSELPPGSKALSPLSNMRFFSTPSGEQILLLPFNEHCVAVNTVRVGAPFR